MSDFNLETRFNQADELIQKFYREAQKSYVPERHPLNYSLERFLDELLRAGEYAGVVPYFMATGRGYNRLDINDYVSLLNFYRSFFEVEAAQTDDYDDY